MIVDQHYWEHTGEVEVEHAFVRPVRRRTPPSMRRKGRSCASCPEWTYTLKIVLFVWRGGHPSLYYCHEILARGGN